MRIMRDPLNTTDTEKVVSVGPGKREVTFRYYSRITGNMSANGL
mgnify:CR=1 FL=1